MSSDGKLIKEGYFHNEIFVGNKISAQEAKKVISGNTAIYENGIVYHHSDGSVVHIKSDKSTFVGKFYIKNNKLCYKYKNDSEEHCKDNYKNKNTYFHNSIGFSIEKGDSRNLMGELVKMRNEEKKAKAAEKEKILKQKQLVKKAKKLIGKKVKWREYKNIKSDDCALFGMICHSVKYRFQFTGVVSGIDIKNGEYDVKLSSAKLIPQSHVAMMYWKYKSRAENWADRQKGNLRSVKFEYVSKL